jgi:hypothetical protein
MVISVLIYLLMLDDISATVLLVFSLTVQPSAGYGLLVHKVS